MKEKIYIDGSIGEGDGQVLRTALSLSMITGRPFTIAGIRAKRPKPGLQRQHCTAVEAAALVCSAECSGASLGSTSLTFSPGPVVAGDYHFATGSAGSTTLVLQTLLPPLMLASEPSTVRIEGGTHNPFAPPVHFLTEVFLPQLAKMGPKVSIKLDRYGFYPVGGGKIRVVITPSLQLRPIAISAAGKLLSQEILGIVSGLEPDIAEKEVEMVKRRLKFPPEAMHVEEVDSPGPGNVLMARISYEQVSELVIAFGEQGLRREAVAARVCEALERYRICGAPVGEHLADQLMIPFALAGEGRFICGIPSDHVRTNAAVIEKFLPVQFSMRCLDGTVSEAVQQWEISVVPKQ